MARTTSIVSYAHFLRLYLTSISIGMASFNKQRTGPMELLLLANARLRLITHSFMSSMLSNLVLTGITRIYVSLHSLIPKIFANNWYQATQYCDGLRGALVIYDLDDPHCALYDVDDGKLILLLLFTPFM